MDDLDNIQFEEVDNVVNDNIDGVRILGSSIYIKEKLLLNKTVLLKDIKRVKEEDSSIKIYYKKYLLSIVLEDVKYKCVKNKDKNSLCLVVIISNNTKNLLTKLTNNLGPLVKNIYKNLDTKEEQIYIRLFDTVTITFNNNLINHDTIVGMTGVCSLNIKIKISRFDDKTYVNYNTSDIKIKSMEKYFNKNKKDFVENFF